MGDNNNNDNPNLRVLEASTAMARALLELPPEGVERAISSLCAAIGRLDLLAVTKPDPQPVVVQAAQAPQGVRARRGQRPGRPNEGPRNLREVNGMDGAQMEATKAQLQALNEEVRSGQHNDWTADMVNNLREARQYIQDCQSYANKGYYRSYRTRNQTKRRAPEEPDWFQTFVNNHQPAADE